MAPNTTIDPIEAGNTALGWVSRYGLPAVFAMVLLAYFIWLQVQFVTAFNGSLTRISQTQEVISASQQDTSRVLQSIQQTLGQQRLGLAPTGR